MRGRSLTLLLLATVTIAGVAIGGIALADTAEPTQTGELSDLQAPANATVGDTIAVSATVTNTANESGAITAEYRFNDQPRANETVNLSPGNATTVSFSFTTSGVDPGEYTHGIYTENDTLTANITLEAAEDPGPAPGDPPDAYAAFAETIPLRGQQVDPSSLGGKFRVEDEHHPNTSVRLVTDNETNTSFEITVTGNATNVTFYVQTQAVASSQNLENVTATLDGDAMTFYADAGPGNSPWIAFQIDHFSTRTVSFEQTGVTRPTLCQYATDSGHVRTSGLLEAIADWRSDAVGTDLLLTAIDHWRSDSVVGGCA